MRPLFSFFRIFYGLAQIGLIGATQPALALDPGKGVSQYRLDVWAAKDGLPGRTVRGITQSSDGFLWLATEGGVARFDGVSFRLYNAETTLGMTQNRVTGIAWTPGGLWASTNGGGLGRFEKGAFVRKDSGQTQWSEMDAVYSASDGSLWFGGEGPSRLQRLGPDGRWTRFPTGPNRGEISAKVDAIVERGDRVWIAMESYLGTGFGGGLLVLDRRDHSRSLSVKDGLPSECLTALCPTPDGGLWIGTRDQGAFLWKNGRVAARVTVGDGLPTTRVQALCLDRDGALWIGTHAGLARLRPPGVPGPRLNVFRRADGLSDDNVRALFEDREGNLWVAAGAGLNRFTETPLSPFRLSTPRGMAIPTGVCEDTRGQVWIGTDLGLYCLPNGIDPQGARLMSPPGQDTAGLCADPDGSVWSVDRQGVIRHWIGGRAVPAGRKDGWAGIAYDRDGLLFYMWGGVARLRGDQVVNVMTAGSKGRTFGMVFSAFVDPRGVTWLATDAGLVEVRHDRLFLYTRGLPPQAHVLSICDARDGGLWLATDKGLVRFDNGRMRVYTSADGLPDDNLYEVSEDLRGTLWVGSSKGLYTIQTTALSAPRPHPDLNPRLYRTEEGAIGMQFGCAVLQTRSGRLWFMGDGGFTLTDGRAPRPGPPPTVLVDRILANANAVRPGQAVAPGCRNLEIDYTAPSFAAPERIQFRYRLIGSDRDWVDAGTRRAAFYTNLPPGRYRFEVAVRGSDGVWSVRHDALSLMIRPFWWQTVWAQALLAAAVLTALGGLIWLRLRGLRERNQMLERRVADRTEQIQAMHEEVLAQNEEMQQVNLRLLEAHVEAERMNRELHEANTQLEALATTDGLTGLVNHRTFQERLAQDWARTARTGQPVSVILLDVDQFKQYNDSYGHPAGDGVLKEIAQCLRETGRAGDTCARYGGEEFVVVLPETDLAGAAAFAERLRAVIEGRPWPLRAVTASLGVAVRTSEMESTADLIAAADQALYVSKKSGRNRVTCASGERMLRAA